MLLTAGYVAANVLICSPCEVLGIQVDPSLASGVQQSVDVDLFTATLQSLVPLSTLPQAPSLTLESVLSGILYMRVQHYTEQLALVAVLDMLLQQQPQVRQHPGYRHLTCYHRLGVSYKKTSWTATFVILH